MQRRRLISGRSVWNPIRRCGRSCSSGVHAYRNTTHRLVLIAAADSLTRRKQGGRRRATEKEGLLALRAELDHGRRVAPNDFFSVVLRVLRFKESAERSARTHQTSRSRQIADIRSAANTITKITISSSETSRYWNRFIAVSSSNPMPPAPTKPSTSDDRIFSSNR